MQRYILIRVIQAVATLIAISIVVFLLARLTGDPRNLLLPENATKEDWEAMGQVLGLDQPLPVQYWKFASHAVKGDLGKSIRTTRPVKEMLFDALPNSVKLSAAALIVAMLIAIPLGILAAVKRGSFWDWFARTGAFLGQSLPSFWVGIMLILLFSIRFTILPPFGMAGPLNYIMPSFALGFAGVAGILRLTRSSMLDVLDAEYVKLARAKGLSEWAVIWKHALRNALIPVVTLGGMFFAAIIGSAIVIETVFAWPGLGRMAYDAVVWRDFPLIQGVVLLISIIVLGMNLLVDVLYAYIDPRIRYS